MSSKDKRHNARVFKWRAMIDSGIYKDQELLKSRIRKGIPAAVRMLAWPRIVRLNQFIQSKRDIVYTKLINLYSKNIYEIGLDIPRTFPEQEDSKVLRKSLNNVLKALSIVSPRVGYCQGMNFLVLRILEVLEDDDSFWLLYYLFENDPILMKNFAEPSLIVRENDVFMELLHRHMPSVHAKFEKDNIMMQAYSIKWFITLFSSVLSQQLFNRIFEVFLFEGWTIIFAVGLNLLKRHEQTILVNSFEQNLYLLNSDIYHITDSETFMEEVYAFALKEEDLKQLFTEQDLKIRKKKSASNRTPSILKQNTNNDTLLRIPQDEDPRPIIFKNKAEELQFKAFLLIDTQKIKK